jgi:hypothetical protein
MAKYEDGDIEGLLTNLGYFISEWGKYCKTLKGQDKDKAAQVDECIRDVIVSCEKFEEWEDYLDNALDEELVVLDDVVDEDDKK